jgi:tetratricopeptide (TPR) repeat protein
VLSTEAPTGADRPIPLFGRHETSELALKGLQSTADAGTGRILLLTGVGGVGKTTVLRSIREAAGGLGYRVLPGRSLPTDVPRPFALVQELLKAAQHERRAPEAVPLAGPGVPLFAAAYDRAADGALPGVGPAGRDVREADRLLQMLASPSERIDADRATFYAQLTQFFLQLATTGPLLLALDDLQFADDSSLDLLRKLPPHLGGSPLMVVGTSTPLEEAPPRSAPALERLFGTAGVERHPIRPMTENELGEYILWILHGRDPGRDAVMRWFTQTEGNPLFTEYLVRTSTGFGSPTTPDAGTADLDELLKARIAGLPAPAHRVLVYASVLGKEFDFASLDAAVGQEEERLSEHLELLVHQGLLREGGGEVYDWVSERARVDVYSQLTETRRRLLHRKVARAMMAGGGATESNLFELARQCYLGRDDGPAADLSHRAAEVAARAFAFDTAAVQIERALECQRRLIPRDVPGEIRLLIELGRFLGELGDLRRSEETLQDAVARARTRPDLETELAFALLGLAQTEYDISRYGSARELAAEAFAILVRGQNSRGILAAHRVLGVVCWRLGDLSVAVEHQRSAISLAETVGTPSEKGHGMIDLANTYTLMGTAHYGEAATLYEQAAKIFAETGDPGARARVLMNRALLHHYGGEVERAVEVVREALAAAELSRSPIWIGYCCINLAQLQIELSRPAEATEAVDRAAGLLTPLGDHLADQQILMIRGMIAECGGDRRVAERRYRESLELAENLSLSAERVEVQYRLANLAYHHGDRALAARLLKLAWANGIDTLRSDLVPRARELRERLAGPDPPSPQG